MRAVYLNPEDFNTLLELVEAGVQQVCPAIEGWGWGRKRMGGRPPGGSSPTRDPSDLDYPGSLQARSHAASCWPGPLRQDNLIRICFATHCSRARNSLTLALATLSRPLDHYKGVN